MNPPSLLHLLPEKMETEMYDSEYAIDVIMRNRSKELNHKLERMARYNSFPVTRKPTKRIINWMSIIVLSIRNVFVS